MQTSVIKAVACAMVMGLLAVVGGCASSQATGGDSGGRVAKPAGGASVNSVCVVVNDLPVNTRVETEDWRGQKVGFCCYSCKPKWNAMSDAEKDEAVARAVAASK